MNKALKIIINGFLLIILPLLGQAGLVGEIEKQIKEKQAQIQELEKQVIQLKEAIKGKQSEQTTLKKQVNLLESEIRRLEFEIKLTQAKISQTNLEIERLGYNIQEQEKELDNQKNHLLIIIRIINEYDQETPIELILKHNNFSDFLNQVQYLESLQRSIQKKVERIKNLKEQLTSQKQEQEAFKESLLSLNEELRGKNLVLNYQKSDKEDLLITTKNQEQKYQAQLKELQTKRQEIQKEIYQLEDKLRLAIDPASIPGARKGLLEWPIRGVITQIYGPTSITGFVNNVYNFHNGIDISGQIGDPIKAALGGTVTGIGDNGKYAYGKWISIDHHNGLTTLYAHLSLQKVAVGQKVKRGEVIGYVGSTGFSTGPHLHLTVYATGTFKIESRWFGLLPIGGPINPINYLE